MAYLIECKEWLRGAQLLALSALEALNRISTLRHKDINDLRITTLDG